MKRLLLFVLALSFCSFIVAQAQSQTSSRKRPEFSPHSKRAQFAKPPHSWFEKMEGDSSEMARRDERLRNSLPNLPPHLLAERQWLLQSEAENAPTGAAELEPNDPLDRLFPPHKRALTNRPNSLQNAAPHHSAQSFQSGAAQILAGGVQEAWVARYNGRVHGNEEATAMVMDGSGNIYVTGYSSSFGYSSTVKYNAAGAKQWTARYDGSANTNNQAVALAVDGSGNVYVTGTSGTVKYNSAGTQEWVANGSRVALAVDGIGNVYVTGYTGYSDTYPNYDYATVKYNSVGTQEWVRTYNGPGNGEDFARALAVDGTGNVYVTGHSWNGANEDYATVKYNSAGQEQWVARYNGPRNGQDFPRALAVDGAGNVYVTGSSTGINYGNANYSTVKYNSAGTQKWVRTYNGPENGNDHAVDLTLDGTGNIYVTGYSVGSGTGFDYPTLKYNSTGTQLWVATLNDYHNHSVNVGTLAVDGSDNVYVTGLSGTVKYNSAGTQEWVTNKSGVDLAVDAVGNVYVVGSSYSSSTASDYVTVKYDALGAEQWVARHDELGGHTDDIAKAMVIDSSGNIHVTGSSGTIKYNSAGVQEWVADGGDALAVDGAGNIYVKGSGRIVKYNSAGAQEWVAEIGEAAFGIDAAGNVYVTRIEGSHQQWEVDSDFEEYNFNIFTTKYNSAGIQEWVKSYPAGHDVFHDEDKIFLHAPTLVVDSAGNVYVAGIYYNNRHDRDGNPAFDYVTVKYNSAGTQEWAAQYNGPAAMNDYDFLLSLAVDPAGGESNVYVALYNGWSNVLVKYNAAGQKQWAADFHDYCCAVALAADGLGNVYVTTTEGTIKYNSAGKREWVVDWRGKALTLDNAGNVYVTGFGWAAPNGYGLGTIKFNSAGTQEWVVNASGVALAVDGAGNVYVTGSSVGSGTGYDYATSKYTQILPPIANAGPDKEICAGGSVLIGGSPTGSSSSGGPYAFNWTPATGLNDPTAPNPIASPATTTTYTVTVTETATGLSATDTVTVTIPKAGWSVAHIVDVDDVIFGIDQGATFKAAPRDNRGLALSPNKRFLYLGYSMSFNKRLVRKIDLSVSDPANNHNAVVAQLQLPFGSQPARDIATDDRDRVYLALGTKIEIYNSNLQAPPLHTISGFTACEGVAMRRENGALVVYATERLDKTLKRFVLVEGAGETIASSSKTGLDGDGEVLIVGGSRPRGLDIASDGTVWIADFGKNRVYRINAAGKTVDSTGVGSPMDVAIDESRGEVYVSQYTLRTIKVLNLSTGKIKRTLTPPAADLNVDLEGETGLGALCGIDVASCKRVYVANENGRSLLDPLTGDSPFSNIGDNNDVKAADTDPVLVVTGSGLAKESEVEESEEEVAVAEAAAVTSYELAQNYPNPFSRILRVTGNPGTVIGFALPEPGKVTVNIYNEIGQLVRTLVDHEMAAGRHAVHWNGRDQFGNIVAAGIYFYRIVATGENGETAFIKTQRLTMVK